MTHEELINRAKELQELDSNPDIATYQDIDNLPKGRVIVPWGPGSGKSTAIRNWIASHPESWCIYATHTIEEATDFYNDLMAMKEYGTLDNVCQVTLYHKDTKVTTKQLQRSNVVVCTHERLLIEPPKILYRTDTDEMFAFKDNYKSVRSHVFIDELPDGYKKILITNEIVLTYSSLLDIINRHSSKKDSLSATSLTIIRALYERIYNNYDNLKALPLHEAALATSLTSQLTSLNISTKPKVNHKKDIIDKATYFSMLILNKLIETLNANNNDISPLIGKYVYYSILDLPKSVDNIYIFDGTGDISMRDSSYWTTANSGRFYRRLLLNQYPEVISNSNLIRNEKSDKDRTNNQISLNNILEYITELLDNNPESKVLIYSWMNMRIFDWSDENQFTDDLSSYNSELKSMSDYIIDHLDEDHLKRVSVIYYQSGKDKCTSEFSEYDHIVILGKFNLPSPALSLLNKVRGCSITKEEYCKALIIQAIARTQLRVRKSINIHFNSDFTDEDIRTIMKSYKECFIDDKLIDPDTYLEESNTEAIIESMSSNTQKLLMEFLTINYIDRVLRHEPIELTSTELAKAMNCRSDNIPRCLSQCKDLQYSYHKGTGRYNPGRYVITYTGKYQKVW